MNTTPQERDPFHCDICGCALHDGEDDLCAVCQMNEDVQMEMDRDCE